MYHLAVSPNSKVIFQFMFKIHQDKKRIITMLNVYDIHLSKDVNIVYELCVDIFTAIFLQFLLGVEFNNSLDRRDQNEIFFLLS